MEYSDDLVKEFLVESFDNIEQMDQDFVTLEKQPDDAELISNIFRSIHTIKGTCGFFGFQKLEAVAHSGENVLSKLREGKLSVTPEITTALLQVVDAVREILKVIETTGTDGDNDFPELVARMNEILAQEDGAEPEKETAKPTDTTPSTDADAGETSEEGDQAESDEESESAPTPTSSDGDPKPPEAESPSTATGQDDGKPSQSLADSTIRVDVQTLDNLMNMVGELVLARNQTLQFCSKIEDPDFHMATQRLNLITTELQEGIMKTRMQPIGTVLNKFPRVVRDVSVSINKEVRLEMEGKETELDKTILEAIRDPLTHIIRNSVDHGIETPDVREAVGKPREGLLSLRAFHEDGQVNIEIRDDGAGVDPEVVKAKAIERGLITPDQAQRLTEREVVNMLFLPGFSTAKKVTNISGRGVGMDVVKTNIEKIGGTVDLHSQFGKGTTLRIKIPLTLAIIPALIVMCRGERYAIPQVSLLELVRLDGQHELSKIEHIHNTPVYRLRGNLLPLVYLERLLGIAEPEGEGETSESFNVVVLQVEDQQFGLIIDQVLDTEEIVVKPLGNQLKSVPAFAGATIMGDGNIALILDVTGIARSANVLGDGLDNAESEGKTTDDAEEQGEKRAMLLFECGEDDHMAIPLLDVTRLEEFKRSALEHVGGEVVVQYREQIMPLIDISLYFGGTKISDANDDTEDGLGGVVHVVVHEKNGQYFGLLVNRIEDISEQVVQITAESARNGVLHTAVIDGRVREFLDVDAILRDTIPSFVNAA